VDPVTVTAASVLAESASVLKSALQAVPSAGPRRLWHRQQRLRAYLAFQRAAHEASVWPVWLGVLEQVILAKEVTMAQVMPDMAACRSATSALLAALSEIRLTGNPEPRGLAEEIVTLLAELMEARLPGMPPRGLRIGAAEKFYEAVERRGGLQAVEERIPGLAGRVSDMRSLLDKDAREAKADRFNDCQLALGAWHRKFTLAARKDLGYGPRWWHVGRKPQAHGWQKWRPYDEWPGGWPPPEASELISQASEQRSAREAGRSDAQASEEPGSLAVADVRPDETTPRRP
jgi:hypothetical protein